MTEERAPQVGDYWCAGLLTRDFFAAVNHAAKYARENNVTAVVQRYRLIGLMPLMDDVAIIHKP